MTKKPDTVVKVVFGAMTFGQPNTLGARVHTIEAAGQILDIFQKHGHEEIDTARGYGNGSSETMLAQLNWRQRGIAMATKLYPTYVTAPQRTGTYSHKPEDLRRGLMDSLEALGSDKIDMFYLHGPDRKTPFEETLREVNNLYEEGYFNRFGISNFMSWEVARICEICEKHGWIKPSVYQGIYNALHRTVEAELIPCLRHYDLSLYAFQPLAGGFLTGRYTRDQTEFEPGSRFDPKIFQGGLHHARYWNDNYFKALDYIRTAGEKHGLTVAEVALRWLEYHSELREANDAIIVGASSADHLEENLTELAKGALPDDVVQAVDNAWLEVKAVVPKYWH
ncbi:Aldo/keto reductase [Ilyonectria sp. MPI-CAGE-AT-0026]|nr:Aldo/keto reductase [Ilyonectria sp. MPI-CAGE-AT-0026]